MQFSRKLSSAILMAVAPVLMNSFATAAIISKANNTTTLSSTGSWVGSVVPGTADTAQFDSTVTTAISVSQGALSVGNIVVTNPGGNITINQSTATLTLNTNGGGIDMSSATADLTFAGSGGFVRAASANSTPTFNVAAGRTLTFGGNVTNQGNNKTMQLIGSGNIIFNGAIGNSATVPLAMNINGANVTLNGTTNFNAGSNALTLTTGQLNLGNDNALVQISGTKALNVNGGTITASGGAHSVAVAGGYTLGGNATIGGSNDLTLASTLTCSGANRTLTISNTGATTLTNVNCSETTSNRTLTIDGASNVTINGTISNGPSATAAGISYNGTGTLSITGTGASSFGFINQPSAGGQIVVNATTGSVSLGSLSTFGTSTTAGKLDVQSGTVNFNGGIQTNTADGSLIKVSGGTFSASDVNLQRTTSFTSLPSAASATNGLVVTAGTANIGTLRIGTSNSSSSALLNGGSLTATGQVTIGNTSNTRYSILEVRSGTFSSSDTTNGIVLSPNTASANNSELLLTGGTSTIERIGFGASSSIGTGYVVVNGASAAVYLGSGGMVQNSGSGTASVINLTSGLLGAKADWASALSLNLNGSAFTIQAADAATAAKNIALSGVISGTGNLNKTGAGSLTLSGANIYNGSTSVTAGSLVVNGSVVSNISVSNSAILGGSGTISGTVSIADGSLAPGNSPGTLTISNSLSLASSSSLSYDLLGTDMTVGGGINDLTDGVTNLTLDGTLNVNETTAGSFASAVYGNTWRLINYSGTLTDNGLTLGSTPTLSSGLSFQVDTSTAGQINLTVVPEPTTLAIVALGFGSLMRRRREYL